MKLNLTLHTNIFAHDGKHLIIPSGVIWDGFDLIGMHSLPNYHPTNEAFACAMNIDVIFRDTRKTLEKLGHTVEFEDCFGGPLSTLPAEIEERISAYMVKRDGVQA